MIRKGITDANELKAKSKVGMGACGAKTCSKLIEKLFREEGVSHDQITPFVQRPLFIEVPLKYFTGSQEEDK